MPSRKTLTTDGTDDTDKKAPNFKHQASGKLQGSIEHAVFGSCRLDLLWRLELFLAVILLFRGSLPLATCLLLGRERRAGGGGRRGSIRRNGFHRRVWDRARCSVSFRRR